MSHDDNIFLIRNNELFFAEEIRLSLKFLPCFSFKFLRFIIHRCSVLRLSRSAGKIKPFFLGRKEFAECFQSLLRKKDVLLFFFHSLDSSQKNICV